MTSTYSRRSFLKMAAAVGAASALAACQPVDLQTQGGAAAPSSQDKLVRILMPSWATAEIPYDAAAREFNEAHPGTVIQIQTTTEGWDTKVMSQIAEGALEWCGAGIASSASSSQTPGARVP